MSLPFALLLAALAGAAAGLAAALSGLGYRAGGIGWLWVGAALAATAAAAVGAAAAVRRRELACEVARLRGSIDAQAQQAADAKRLAMLGTLAAGLAHELGQPLSAARVGIEGLHYLRQLGREPSAEHVSRTLARVGLSVLAMTQTIEHLKSLANPHVVAELDEIDLVASVEAILGERDHWLRYSDTRIEWERPSAPVRARGDQAGLRLILTNLLRNAVEAVASQGTDRRFVRVVAGPGPVLVVADGGPGIAPDVLAHLFEPFVSTKGGAARGVGLSLAKASAQRMGADLEARSAIGAGSTFTVRLRPAGSA